MLTKKEQRDLKREIARDTIVSYVTASTIPAIALASKGLNLATGCFVAVEDGTASWGCIGNFISDQPLYRLVQEMAVSAATRDPRFYPSDLEAFELEISVFSPLQLDLVGKRSRWGHTASTHRQLPWCAAAAGGHGIGFGRDTFLRHTCLDQPAEMPGKRSARSICQRPCVQSKVT